MKHFKTKLTMAVVACMLMACTKPKNDVKPCDQATDVYSKHGIAAKEHAPKNPPNTVMNYYGDDAGWCSYPPAINCMVLKEVTVKAMTILNNLNRASSSDVAATFRNNSELAYVAENIPADFLEKLKSGNYFMSTKNITDTKVSYLVGKISPITMDNFEFALQFNKKQ